MKVCRSGNGIVQSKLSSKIRDFKDCGRKFASVGGFEHSLIDESSMACLSGLRSSHVLSDKGGAARVKGGTRLTMVIEDIR